MLVKIFMYLGGEVITTTLLSQHSSYFYFKYVSLYQKMNVVLISYQGNFSL